MHEFVFIILKLHLFTEFYLRAFVACNHRPLCHTDLRHTSTFCLSTIMSYLNPLHPWLRQALSILTPHSNLLDLLNLYSSVKSHPSHPHKSTC